MKAKKSLGQNFLKSQRILKKIIDAADLDEKDTIVEVGPGHGALTERLLNQSGKVIAVELDDRLIPELEKKFGDQKKFSLHHQDALTFQPPRRAYKVIANIPYYITSPLINHFLSAQIKEGNLPKSMVLLIQKEVAQKITDPEKNSVLSLSVKLFGTPRIIAKVPPSAFTPKPKVDSAILKISSIQKPTLTKVDDFMQLIKIGFHMKRKTLLNNLNKGMETPAETIEEILKHCEIDPKRRPETLSLKEWIRLFQAFSLKHSTSKK